ncbi:MAG: hypothetical protein JJ891_01835 [Rhizobiaceae bacterium]|nr:hypothetical protein [Rhizobiaceae bacterium]
MPNINLRCIIALVLLLTCPFLIEESLARELECGSVKGLSLDSPMNFCIKDKIYVAAVGHISENTHNDLLNFLNASVNKGYEIHSITFHSLGGTMLSGMLMGAFIREVKLDTHVGKGSVCASACFLAFIGGWSRKVTHDGKIGNHQMSYSTSTQGDIQAIQDMIGILSEYHKSLNVSPLAVTAAMTRRSNEMYWYSPKEQKEWGVVTTR